MPCHAVLYCGVCVWGGGYLVCSFWPFWPDTMATMVLHTCNASRVGCMSHHALYVVCWNYFCALPRCLWAVGCGTPSVHCHTALGQWVVEFLLYIASLPVGSGLLPNGNGRDGLACT